MNEFATFQGIIIGLLSGIVSSILSTMIIRFIRPRIIISDKIARAGSSEKPEYRLKFVNLSKSYAKNVRVTAQLINRQNAADGGTLITTRPLQFIRTDFGFIEPYNKADTENRYAVRLKFKDPLEELWDDPTYTSLEIAIYCENETSGVGKVFKKVYYSRSCISNGVYETGKSVNLILDS